MHVRIFIQLFCYPVFAVAVGCLFAASTQAATATLSASKDNTLINDTAGSASNGTGNLFIGKTGGAGPGALRGLLAFDIAAEVPAGSIVTDVQLTLDVLKQGGGSGSDDYSLHAVDQDWGEGTSFATGGGGAASTTGDATWIHTFFDLDTWTTPGGDFQNVPSATQTLEGLGLATWGSTDGLVADVQSWLDDPGSNFGWILIGNESANASAREFASRDASNNAPELLITFTPIPEPSSLLLAACATLCSVSLSQRRKR